MPLPNTAKTIAWLVIGWTIVWGFLMPLRLIAVLAIYTTELCIVIDDYTREKLIQAGRNL